MIKQIDRTAIYVTGASRSAIYDFKTGKVYSINAEGTQIVSDYFSNRGMKKHDFITQVENMLGINMAINSDYVFPQIEPHLDFAWLEITQKCNYRCIHCYQGEQHSEVASPLSIDEWKDVISQCAEIGCNRIQFIGGEPSICCYLTDLIAHADKMGIKEITLFSNLSLVPDNLVLSILNHHVKVRFSIYGATASQHDAITQIKGSFDTLCNNITHLATLNIPLQANIVIMKENEAYRDMMTDFLYSIGINSIYYDEIRKVYGGKQSSHLVTNPRFQSHRPNFRTSRETFEKNHGSNTCWFGKLVISTDGAVFPCVFERKICYGNIRQTNIKDMIKGESISKYWHLSYDKIMPCRVCEYRFACKDCRPIAYAEHGCITEKNPRCFYDPLNGIWQ